MEQVGEALSSRELTEWTAFERVWGPLLIHERVDLGFAQMAFYLASLLGQPKHGRFRFKDFLPAWMRPEKPADDENASVLHAALQAWANEGRG